MVTGFIAPEQLLGEVEDLIRTSPGRDRMTNDDPNTLAWIGRARAVVAQWSAAESISFQRHAGNLYSGATSYQATLGIMTILEMARHDLRIRTRGPLNVAADAGMVFQYFDSVRKIIEEARKDVLFVDPYLDAEFVSRYLAHLKAGVQVRMLAREKLATLLPAVDAFVAQSKATVQVRSASGFHDRYVFIDKTACYQSGASFKDGARNAPTTLAQLSDLFPAALKTYEDKWATAKVER